MKRFILIAVLPLSLNSFGQLVDLFGRVFYENGDPALGVIASLRDLPFSDTTGVDGTYHLVADIARSQSFPRQAANPYYSDGRLYFKIEKRQGISVDIYNLNGELVTGLYKSELEEGAYSIKINSSLKSRNKRMLTARLKTGDRISFHKFFNSGLISSSCVIKKESHYLPDLAKTSGKARIDELKLNIGNRILTTFEITSYTDTLPDFIITESYDSLTAADFRISNEISGWSEKANGYIFFDSEGLFSIINGGADLYRNFGLIEGITQELESGRNNDLNVFVMYFGTTDRALAIYNQQEQYIPNKLSIGKYSNSVVIGEPILGGIIVYAHFSNFYFEMAFMGYADLNQAAADAEMFLDFYFQKVADFAGPPLQSTQVTLGAQQSASFGAALDLDSFVVYTASQAVGNETKIDLYLGYSIAGNALRIMSPAEAANDGFAPQNWPATNATRFYQTSLTPAEFDAIETQLEIDTLWNASSALSEAQLDITGGEVIIAETDQGVIRLIKVDNVSAQSASANVTIIGYR